MADETLNVRVTADVSQASGAFGGLNKVLGGLGNVITTGVGFAFGGLLTRGIDAAVGAVGNFIGAASDAEQGQAQLNAVLKSTQGAAGLTADEINNMASHLQDVTRFEDDTVLSGQNLLLTFTKIGKDVFPEATATMLDMSQALGQDVKSSAVQLGKALNDPINGVTALQRVGVSFTEEQKEQIKTLVESGKTMEAQKLILAELQKEFGGVAEAAGNTFAGKMDILQHKLGDVMETIGGALLPILTQGADALIQFLNNPQVQAGAQQIVGFIEQIGGQITALVSGLQSGNIGKVLSDAIFGPLSSSTTGAGITTLISGLQSAFGSLMSWVTGELAPALATAFQQIAVAAQPTLQGLATWAQNVLVPALQQVWQLVGPLLSQAFAALGDAVTQQLIPQLTAFGVLLFSKVLPELGNLLNIVGGAINGAVAGLVGLWGQLTSAFQGTVKFIGDVRSALDGLAGTINGGIATALQGFTDNVLEPLRAAFDSIAGAIQGVVEWIKTLAATLGIDLGTPFLRDALGNFGIKGFAGGGRILAGQPSIVGELGPELFVPGQSGLIIPNHMLGAGMGTVLQLVYAPQISTLDQYEMESRLRPAVEEIIRRYK